MTTILDRIFTARVAGPFRLGHLLAVGVGVCTLLSLVVLGLYVLSILARPYLAPPDGSMNPSAFLIQRPAEGAWVKGSFWLDDQTARPSPCYKVYFGYEGRYDGEEIRALGSLEVPRDSQAGRDIYERLKGGHAKRLTVRLVPVGDRITLAEVKPPPLW
jgi:hypothetical protein